MSEATRVLVVDDHPLFRQGVVATLTREPGIEVVAEAESIAEALRLTRALKPDVVLLDVALPDGTGIDAIQFLRQAHPGTRILMLTVNDASEAVIEAVRSGAAGYLLKGSSANEVVTALRTVALGGTYASPGAAASLISEVARPRRAVESELTPREQEVHELLGEGLTNREIAGRLVLSEKTVKRHVTVVMQKLGVRNRVEAALLARKRPPGGRVR